MDRFVKRVTRATAALLLISLTPTLAQTYFAADYDNVHAPGSTMEGMDFGLGFRFGQFLAVEGGYEGAYQSTLSFNGGYLDATTYLPLGETNFEAFLSGGGVALSGETPIHDGFIARWDTGLLAQAGIDYRISPNWALRVGYRYQTPGVHTTSETIGLIFAF